MHFRSIILALGFMLILLGAAMLPCALIDISDGREEWHVFAISSFASLLLGAVLWVLARGEIERTGQREAFLLTVLVWVVLPFIAAIPFLASGMAITDAMFESVSGLTTTGATVLTGLDNLPRGFLLWRAILQWIGGIGIIVTAIAILPQLRVGGMQLFELESSDQSGKFFTKVEEIALGTGAVYIGLTMACALLYTQTGMSGFDAVAHAMTTMAAGGFSTHDASFRFFDGTGAIWVAIVFMSIAGLPFSLMAVSVFKGQYLSLFKEPEPRLFYGFIAFFTLVIFAYALATAPGSRFASDLDMFKHTLFSVVSVMTGTGYASSDYDVWGMPAVVAFLVLTFLGGCAGSAACGIKMFRLELSVRAIIAHSQKMVSRRRLTPVRFKGRVVDQDTLQSVMVFVFLYLATFLLVALALSLTGLDPLTAISGAATSVSNVGPGLGPTIGPDGTFQTLPDIAKWLCAGAMLLGRLEFVPVFAVLTRRFWAS